MGQHTGTAQQAGSSSQRTRRAMASPARGGAVVWKALGRQATALDKQEDFVRAALLYGQAAEAAKAAKANVAACCSTHRGGHRGAGT